MYEGTFIFDKSNISITFGGPSTFMPVGSIIVILGVSPETDTVISFKE